MASTTTTTTCTPEEKKKEEEKKKQEKKPAAKKPAAPPPPKKAEPVFTPEDIFRFVDLGLGRGIDATNPTPWLNKSSFQVRRVHESNIIGTEEGGALQSYEREVSSVHTQQTSMKSSIVVPQSPITLGTDAEQSRSVSTSRRAIGRRVINRSVSFRDDFVDVPLGGAKTFSTAQEETASEIHVHKKQAESEISDAQQSILTFEERLAQWLVQRISAYRLKVKALERLASDSEGQASSSLVDDQVNPLESLALIIDRGNRSELKLLIDGCREFVYHFRITHYVSSIEMGAAEYRVLTEQEYFSKVGLSGSFGLEKLVNAAFSGTRSFKKSIKASDMRKIGAISKEGTVLRGSYGEAVVGVKIQPLTNLIRLQFLQLALKKALVQFVETQGDSSDGPFIISCANDKLFLKVDPNTHQVYAIREIKHASNFFIDPTDEGQNRYEFLIVHYGDTGISKEARRKSSSLSNQDVFEVHPVGNYLAAPLSTFGNNSGPLDVRSNVSHEKCRFVLNHRLTHRKSSATAFDLTAWTSGREIFYINCSRRRFKRDGYVCVRQNRPDSFITACVSSPDCHNNTNTFMLFRLLPMSARSLGQSAAIKASVEERELSKLDRLVEEEEEEEENTAHKESARILATVDVHATETKSDAQFSMVSLKND